MGKMILAWLLLGGLGLAGFDAFRARKAAIAPSADSGEVTTAEDGTGFPPPTPPRP